MSVSKVIGSCALPLFVTMLVGCSSGPPISGGGGAPGCPPIGCGPAFTLVAPLPVSFESVRTLRAEVCQNTKCSSSSLAQIVEEPAPHTGVGVSFPDAAIIDATKSGHARVTIMADQAGKLRLEVWYWPWAPTDVQDGDMFHVTLTDSSGRAAFSFVRAIDFAESPPNACPSGCRQAKVDLTDGA
ncbi:MAG TPA: hypothetical protein VK524_15860 [Polyangiaceae bacterium]|nr:hypothetical protein [Polyangiaceae bacterium]